MIDRLPPGTGTARRREQQIDKVVNRGTVVTGLAYGGRFTEARTQGETYLARFAEAATTPGELGAIADAHNGLAWPTRSRGSRDWHGGPTPLRSPPIRRATITCSRSSTCARN